MGNFSEGFYLDQAPTIQVTIRHNLLKITSKPHLKSKPEDTLSMTAHESVKHA